MTRWFASAAWDRSGPVSFVRRGRTHLRVSPIGPALRLAAMPLRLVSPSVSPGYRCPSARIAKADPRAVIRRTFGRCAMRPLTSRQTTLRGSVSARQTEPRSTPPRPGQRLNSQSAKIDAKTPFGPSDPLKGGFVAPGDAQAPKRLPLVRAQPGHRPPGAQSHAHPATTTSRDTRDSRDMCASRESHATRRSRCPRGTSRNRGSAARLEQLRRASQLSCSPRVSRDSRDPRGRRECCCTRVRRESRYAR